MILFLQVGLQRLVHRRLSCWTLEMTMQMVCLQYLLKLPFVFNSTFYKFSTSTKCFSPAQNRVFGTTLSNLTWRFWENLPRLKSSWLMVPISEPRKMSFRALFLLLVSVCLSVRPSLPAPTGRILMKLSI